MSDISIYKPSVKMSKPNSGLFKKSVKKTVKRTVGKTVKKTNKKSKPKKYINEAITDKNKESKNDETLNDTKKSIEKKICASIRSSDEPYLRCLMNSKSGEKYCPMHLSQKKIIDFNMVEKEDISELDIKLSKPTKIVTNNIIKKISLNMPNYPKQQKIIKQEQVPITDSIMHEQKVSTIEKSHKENEDELEIKLLILVNEEYCDKIAELIGPVFQDVTLSEDEQDPVTYDEIWTINDGMKVPSSINKYYLFSYIDSKGKIRCLTIFTVYNMIKENNFIHPITMEQIPEVDIQRAKQLIDLYETKIGLFKKDESIFSPEFKLKNRLLKLFKQFHIHNIYLEENWLLSVNDKGDLYKIIKETEKLVSNNIKSINPNLHNFKIFQKIEPKYSKSSKNKTINMNDDDTILKLQEYIVDEWEKLIGAADNPQNQIPIWILASGLSFVVPQVKQKYPDLEIML